MDHIGIVGLWHCAWKDRSGRYFFRGDGPVRVGKVGTGRWDYGCAAPEGLWAAAVGGGLVRWLRKRPNWSRQSCSNQDCSYSYNGPWNPPSLSPKKTWVKVNWPCQLNFNECDRAKLNNNSTDRILSKMNHPMEVKGHNPNPPGPAPLIKGEGQSHNPMPNFWVNHSSSNATSSSRCIIWKVN